MTLNVTADAFLWDSVPACREARYMDVIDVTAVAGNEPIVPSGMFNQWPLEVLLHITKPFTGLVVLIDLVATHRRPSHNDGLLQLVTACVASLLGPNDFGCRTSEDEFVMVCPGLVGPQAQRRLNQISEQLWEFQQRGHGAASVLFSWGGIGASEKPLSEALVAAVHRMNRINRNRKINSKESVNHRRNVV
jgi:hypothetical protein